MQGGKLQRVFRPWVARFDYRKQQSVSRKGTKAGSTRRLKYGCLRQSNEASLAGSFTPRRDGSHRGSRRLGRHTPTHLGPPTAVSQAFITKDFEDRTGYIIVTDPQGQHAADKPTTCRRVVRVARAKTLPGSSLKLTSFWAIHFSPSHPYQTQRGQPENQNCAGPVSGQIRRCRQT